MIVAAVEHRSAGIHEHGARTHLLKVAREAQNVEGAGLLKEGGKRRQGVLGDIVGRLHRCGDLLKERADGVQVGREANQRQKHKAATRAGGIHNHLVGRKAQVHKRQLRGDQGIERVGDALEQLAGLDAVEGTRQALLQGLTSQAIAHLEHAVGIAHKRAGQQAA
ncbi:MAG: hypothetical protein ACLTXV_00775 [Collinsella sp.]